MSVNFKCSKHHFSCNPPSEWREHLAKEEHVRRGIAPCNLCGIPHKFLFSGKIGDKEPSLCEKCSDKLLKETDTEGRVI